VSKDGEHIGNNNNKTGAAELATANEELAFQSEEKGKRVAELAIAYEKLTTANEELATANEELATANEELATANEELAFQSEEKGKRVAELAIAYEKLTTANEELAFQNSEKDKRAAELAVANTELAFQSEEKDKRASELKNLAFYDSLTGLPNRRLLLDRLNHALATSTRKGSHSAVMFIDLDHFKDINDTLGHGVGDLLLIQIARRLESCLRKGDTVARIGGDEFVLILEELDKDIIHAAGMANAIGRKILTLLNKPYSLGIHEYHSTSSIGAVFFGHEGKTAEELMKQADIAMYQAKQAGRNTLKFFNQKMQDIINIRTTLENELRVAIKKWQFHLYYQIQMDSSNRVLGAEALIRWTHHKRGLVLPATFIPLAEETGLIIPIGKWVVETACAQLGAWQKDTLTRDLTLAVNISARQFQQTDFVDQVQAALQRYVIPANLLKLELTESLLQEDIEATIATMNALNDVGVQFSLDDFGTGYSSLQYIKKLPLDQFKIDQSFVRDIATGSRDKAIIKTIISMAHSLEIEVIAEGVETEEQRQLLLDDGCSVFQGYLFSKPLPIDQFEALICNY
jgi:diguanylate cyclase (GGDEF)-like protein